MGIKGLACAAGILLFVSGAARAFDAAPEPQPSSAPPAAAGVRTAKSLECSQKADSQNLHGKPRRQFMHACKRED